MQTTGNFIRPFIEFTTGMQYRQNHFKSRFMLFLVHIDRNTATVIDNPDRIIFVDIYLDMSGISGKSFVDRVIDNLIHQVMQPFYTDIADIHGRAFTNGL